MCAEPLCTCCYTKPAAEARVAELEDILCRASRLAESQQADLVQQVIQEAWKGTDLD